MLLFLLVFLGKNALAQQQSLKYVDHFWYSAFELEGKEIRKKEARAFFEKNCPSVMPLFRKSRNTEIWAYVAGGAGGFLIGWELDNMVTGKFKTGAFAGFGLVAVGLILENSSKKGYVKVVDMYNKNCQNNNQLSLNWGVTQSNNIGFYMNF